MPARFLANRLPAPRFAHLQHGVRALPRLDPVPVPCLDVRFDGELKVARNMATVPGFDTARLYPLKEAALALWEGFVFVNRGRLRLR